MRIVIADDSMIVREGLARLLRDAGIDVAGTASDAEELLERVERRRPDAVIVDIRMPPTHTDEGLAAADRIRELYDDVGVLVLSQYVESRYALRLLEHHPGGAGYLLKDRVADIAVLSDALRRVCDGECVIDPTIVSRLLAPGGANGSLQALSPREREVLGLMAEGHSNSGIGARLFVTPKTVEAHIHQIFVKLGLADEPHYHRRVRAVLEYLRAQR